MTAFRFRKLADTKSAEFNLEQTNFRQWHHRNIDFGVHYLYNPIGKILVNIRCHSNAGHVLRGREAEAHQRMVRLGYEIRARRIERKSVPEFIQQQPEWGSHPLGARTFEWNDEKGEVFFSSASDQSEERRFFSNAEDDQPQVRRISVPIWNGVSHDFRPNKN